MKGRLYDPALRRFTAPDPYVTEPLNPQGLNRYSYVQNNPMTFTDPSGFECYDSMSACGQALQQAYAQAMAQEQNQAMAMAAAQAAAMGAMNAGYTPEQIAALSNASSNEAAGMAQGIEQANQASARASAQAQAQNILYGDAMRAHDVAFMNPYTTPVPGPTTGNGLYNGLATGFGWSGWLADNGAGGATQGNQRDAGTQGTSANGRPTPYVEQHPVWLQVVASMCLAPEAVAAIRLWKLANDPVWQDFLADAQKRLDAAKLKYGESDAVMSARKPDIKEIDQIVKDLGLNRDQRRLLHDEITKQDLSIEEIRAIAEDIGRQFPKGGR